MLLALVQVQVESLITVKQYPVRKPTGTLNPVTALPPVMWNSGPVGVTKPAAEATAVEGWSGDPELPGFP